MKIKKKSILTINELNNGYTAKNKSALDLSSFENIESMMVDGKNLYIEADSRTIIISKYSKLKYAKLPNSSNYINLINSGLIDNTAIFTPKKKIKGTSYNDTINIDREIKKLNINSGKGNDTITVSDNIYASTITSKYGSNNITINDCAKTTITMGAGSDVITINSSNKNIIKAGNGNNIINLYDGQNTVTLGKNNDIINIFGDSTTSIKAGAGQNTINVDNSLSFGTITLQEEKKKANNTITFNSEFDDEYEFIKENNDFKISNGDDSILTIKDYFKTGSKYASHTIKVNNEEKTLEDLLNYSENNTLTIKGSGTINGTSHSNYIIANDQTSSKAKNDIIKAGKGNDTINAGKGKNSIYFYSGDGNDTIINGGGSDTLIFQSGTNLTFNQPDNSKDLIISYGDDSVTLKDYDSEKGTSVRYVQVGKTKKTLEAWLGKEIKIDKSKIYTVKEKLFTEKNNYTLKIKETTNYETLKFSPSTDLEYIRHAGSEDLTIKLTTFIAFEEDEGYMPVEIVLENYFKNENYPIKNIINYNRTLDLKEKTIPIYADTNDTIIDGTDNDDLIYLQGDFGTVKYITPKKGDDVIEDKIDYIKFNKHTGEYSYDNESTYNYIFNSGDGNDTINGCYFGQVKTNLIFNDEDSLDGLNIEYNDDNIKINYNNNNNSVTLNAYNFTIDDTPYTIIPNLLNINTKNNEYQILNFYVNGYKPEGGEMVSCNNRGVVLDQTNKIIYGTDNYNSLVSVTDNGALDSYDGYTIYVGNGGAYVRGENCTIYNNYAKSFIDGINSTIYGSDFGDTISVSNSTIYAGNGNDSIRINPVCEANSTVYAGNGNNTLNIDGSSELYGGINDDIYNIYASSWLFGSLNLYIEDYGGNDEINLRTYGFARGCIPYININHEGQYENDLYIKNSEAKILIKNYFSDFGKIESITSYFAYEDSKYLLSINENAIDSIKTSVASWLVENGYDDVYSAVTDELNGSSNMNELSTYFQNIYEWQKIQS